MGKIAKGLDYLKSIPSILKIVEFVILLIGIGCVGYFLDKASDWDYKKKGNMQFFMFAVVVGWLLVMALFSLFVIGLHEKITVFSWPLAVAIISALWAVLLLFSSRHLFWRMLLITMILRNFIRTSILPPQYAITLTGSTARHNADSLSEGQFVVLLQWFFLQWTLSCMFVYTWLLATQRHQRPVQFE